MRSSSSDQSAQGTGYQGSYGLDDQNPYTSQVCESAKSNLEDSGYLELGGRQGDPGEPEYTNLFFSAALFFLL